MRTTTPNIRRNENDMIWVWAMKYEERMRNTTRLNIFKKWLREKEGEVIKTKNVQGRQE